MLSYLKIRNFSVFEEVEVEFDRGLNVITGETGAGKSLLVESLKMVLGERFSRDKQRDTLQKTVFEALFEEIALDTETKEKFEIDNSIILRREIDSSGKNRIFINGNLATLNELKEIGKKLVDIHGQHDHQLLLNPDSHKLFIDKLIDENIVIDFKNSYKKYIELKSKLENIVKNRKELEIKKQILQEQLSEIEALNIDIDEDSKLEEKIKFLSNIEKIKNAIDASLQILSYGDISIEKLLSELSHHLLIIKDLKSEFKSVYEKTEDISYEINDIVNTLENIFDFEEYNVDELNNLIDRKMALDKLLKRYGPTLEDLLNHKENIKKELESLDTGDEYIEKLQSEVLKAFEELKNKDNLLYEERRKIAKKLKKGIEAILKELELKDAVFEVKLKEQDKITADGSKLPEFYITTNKGFDTAPLSKVASGGELSRIMLALKEIFAEIDEINTLIFDEVDTGISGKTAKKVGEKLKALSSKKQLIVITHLPIVAAMGNAHFHIIKSSANDKTFTLIKKLNENERKEVLATMISGTNSASSLSQAEELLKSNG
ncbi:DNA repair protein RecN [Deferribacter autotrophicus]|uniref:DNA repair protein RecN n=1 Tax=Deferribacter autotrophicus TaxID=500465 RepID=A0A5A8F764_9BACT|nr:DNA repair protein RecN [Deferribacter autotrophicus]KAA0259164.1 DNA repair protein RecN [Deferribacter autotrophicus]